MITTTEEMCAQTGMTRAQLAAALGVAPRTLYHWNNTLPDGAYFQILGMFLAGALPEGVTVPLIKQTQQANIPEDEYYRLLGMCKLGMLPEGTVIPAIKPGEEGE